MNDVGIGELGSSDTTVVDGGASSTPVIANDTSTTLSDYDIPGVGVVTLAQTGSTITVENVTTEAGYTYAASEPFPGRLDVRFTSDAVEVEFDAQLIDGRVVTVLRSRALGVSGAKAESRDGNRRRENDGERDGEHEEDDDD